MVTYDTSMKVRLPLVILALVLLFCGRKAEAQDASSLDENPFTRVISGETVFSSGAYRFHDLLALSPWWHAVSIEGYTWSASANALDPLEGTTWTVFVDGVPVASPSLGGDPVNFLPLQIHQIDHVEIVDVPTILNGQFAGGGAVHIHTRRPVRGVGILGGLAAGNEIGDPGPYLFTESATPNVDRIGPAYQGLASISDGHTYVQVGIRSDQHHATDEKIIGRTGNLYVGNRRPRLLLLAPSLRMGHYSSWGEVSVSAGHTRFQDLLFFPLFGREIPTTHLYSTAAMEGTLKGPGRSAFRFHRADSQHDYAERFNRGDIDLDWRQERLEGNVEYQTGGSRISGMLGIGVKSDHVYTASALRNPSLLVASAYGQITVLPVRFWRNSAGLMTSRASGRIGVKALLGTSFVNAGKDVFSLYTTYARTLPEEKNDLWYWMYNGYEAPVDSTSSLSLPAYLMISDRFSADAALSLRPFLRTRFQVKGLYRRFQRTQLPAYDFAYASTSRPVNDNGAYILASHARLNQNLVGNVFGLSAGIRYQYLPVLSQEVVYVYTRPFLSDAMFWRSWTNLPWHRIHYTIYWRPVPRFSLYGRFLYTSATRWPDYKRAAPESGGKILEVVPSYINLDLTVQKWFWKDHLSASASLRNVLNRSLTTHPAGAVDNLSLHVSLVLQLGSAIRRAPD